MSQGPMDLVGKAQRVAARAADLHTLASSAGVLVREAEAREAKARADAGEALSSALWQLAAARGRIGDEALRAYVAARSPRPGLAARLMLAPLHRARGIGQRLLLLLARLRPARPLQPALPSLFNADFYARANASALAVIGAPPLEHYARWGRSQGLSPHPLFDVRHYLAQGPDIAPTEDAFDHYLREGWRRGLTPHPLFTLVWSADQTGRKGNDRAPLVAYLERGWREGMIPHPLFDPAWYLDENADVAESGQEPLTHYLMYGAQERRDPSPWFDARWYADLRGDGLASEADPLTDYLTGGAWRVAEPRPGFAAAAYMAAHPDLVRKGLTPLEHWAALGWSGQSDQAAMTWGTPNGSNWRQTAS